MKAPLFSFSSPPDREQHLLGTPKIFFQAVERNNVDEHLSTYVTGIQVTYSVTQLKVLLNIYEAWLKSFRTEFLTNKQFVLAC